MEPVKLVGKGLVASFLMFSDDGPRMHDMDEAAAMADAFLSETFSRGHLLVPFNKETGVIQVTTVADAETHYAMGRALGWAVTNGHDELVRILKGED